MATGLVIRDERSGQGAVGKEDVCAYVGKIQNNNRYNIITRRRRIPLFIHGNAVLGRPTAPGHKVGGDIS